MSEYHTIVVKEEDYKHHYFIKQHHSKEDKEKAERTIFVVNLPVGVTEELLRQVFTPCGAVETIDLKLPSVSIYEKIIEHQILENTYQFAHITFIDKSGAQNALNAESLEPSTCARPVQGLEKYLSEYRATRIPAETLKQRVETFMNQFDLKKIEEKAAAAKKKNEPDEDGWVTVSSKGTFSNQDRSIVVEGVAKMSKEEALAKHKQQILNDFYRFQSRQSKKDNITVLRKKFEADKQRIAQMKATRKFRPY